MSYLENKMDALLGERPLEQEPYGVIVCHKHVPNATQDFIPFQVYKNFGGWEEDYCKVPVYTKPALSEEDREALERALLVLDHYRDLTGLNTKAIMQIQAILAKL